jgi:hypothetical protein
MRRYQEFGYDGDLFGGDFRAFRDPHAFSEGRKPGWVIFPYIDDTISVLQACGSHGNPQIWMHWLVTQDQGVNPDPGCPALHVPRSFSLVGGLNFSGIWSLLTGGIPIVMGGAFTGQYSRPLLTISDYPPWLLEISA